MAVKAYRRYAAFPIVYIWWENTVSQTAPIAAGFEVNGELNTVLIMTDVENTAAVDQDIVVEIYYVDAQGRSYYRGYVSATIAAGVRTVKKWIWEPKLAIPRIILRFVYSSTLIGHYSYFELALMCNELAAVL